MGDGANLCKYGKYSDCIKCKAPGTTRHFINECLTTLYERNALRDYLKEMINVKELIKLEII